MRFIPSIAVLILSTLAVATPSKDVNNNWQSQKRGAGDSEPTDLTVGEAQEGCGAHLTLYCCGGVAKEEIGVVSGLVEGLNIYDGCSKLQGTDEPVSQKCQKKLACCQPLLGEAGEAKSIIPCTSLGSLI